MPDRTVRQGVGLVVFFPRDVVDLEMIEAAAELGDFVEEFLEMGLFDPVEAVDLADQEL